MLSILQAIIFMIIPLLVVLGIEFVVTFTALEVSAVYHLMMLISGRESYGFFKFVFTCINDVSSSKDVLMNMNILCSVLNILVIGLWYFRRYESKEKGERALCFYDKPKIFVALLAMAAGLQMVSSYLTDLVAYVSPAAMEYYEKLLRAAGLSGENLTVMVIIYAIIIGPFSEELIFRGAVLHIGTEKVSFAVANVLQALLFGLFHMNLVQGVYAFVAGMFFGYVANKCHSVKASYVFHLLFNFMGIFAGITTQANQIFAKMLLGMFTISLLVAGRNLLNDGVERIMNEEKGIN